MFTFVAASLAISIIGIVADPLAAQNPPVGGNPPAGANARQIGPPVGLSAVPGITAIELAWVAGPGSTAPVDGFLVYIWRAELGFSSVRRNAHTPQAATHARLGDLQPDTDYLIGVRAATRQPIAGVERIGDWFLSGFSDIIAVRTGPAFTIELLGGSPQRAVFDIGKYVPERDAWLNARFVAGPGATLGGMVNVGNAVEDFNTGFTVDALIFETVSVPGERMADAFTVADGSPFTDADGDKLAIVRPARATPATRLVATITHTDGRQLRATARTR